MSGSKYPLAIWNDSAVPSEMREAVAMQCRGGTSNPPLILKAARAEARWADRAARLAQQYPPAKVARLLADEIRIAAARELLPVFTADGCDGRLCVQVDARNHENPDAMLAEALELKEVKPLTYLSLPNRVKLVRQHGYVVAVSSRPITQARTRAYLDEFP